MKDATGMQGWAGHPSLDRCLTGRGLSSTFGRLMEPGGRAVPHPLHYWISLSFTFPSPFMMISNC